jgi:hypothetical protein
LDKDVFLRTMLRELAGILERTVGEKEAEAYINHVGLAVAEWLDRAYREAYGVERLDPEQIARTLVDLKARIDGGFSVESIDEDGIRLVNTACPFGEQVVGRLSLCRMTANVFGHITAENLGYARVRISESIARGDGRCHVRVAFAPDPDSDPALETEFFGSQD